MTLFTASVVGTIKQLITFFNKIDDKHEVANMPANFHTNTKCPSGDTQGSEGNCFRKNLKLKTSCQTPFNKWLRKKLNE
jgi:hypothetical protein